jgi:RNA-directed DNA polymerase
MSLEPDQVERLRKKLYEKAKREPDFRFYSLYDKVCWAATLHRAYRQAKANAGAAGVDGVRFEDIEAYGEDRWLAELRQELLEETYHPQPVRRVMIPKPGGGERPLGIPTIRDRVAQTAVVLLLEPIFEVDFEDNVYAYRPERSAHDALAEVRKRLYGGQEHVVDADVTQYFDTIPHAELLQSVARRVADGKILRLLKLWLKSPVEERDEGGNRRMTGGKKSKRGTPQGGVVSPLLANIYINRLLRHWRKTGASERLGQIVSYADDFVIVCASRRQAEESLSMVSHWLEKLGLAIHPTKTRLCHAREEPFDFLGYTFGPTAMADRKAVAFGPTLEEGPEEAQGEDQHIAAPGKPYTLAGAANPAQPTPVGMGRILQLRLYGSSRRCHRMACAGEGSTFPVSAAQASRQRNRPLWVRRDPREDGSGRHPPDAPVTKAVHALW